MMKLYFDTKQWVKNYVALAKHKEHDLSKKIDEFYSIGLIDQSICSSNLGDGIITESLAREIKKIFGLSYIKHFPGQIDSSIDYTRMLAEQDLVFVGGTNLLKSKMNESSQWKINAYSKQFLKKQFILFGVGWWQYEKPPNKYTSKLLRQLLSNNFLHSVRDSYSEKILNSIGIENVVNTSCPTLWDVDRELCKNISINKADHVVTTLTSYNRDIICDKKIINILCENYNGVYIWLQGAEDYEYFKDLAIDNSNIILLDSSLEAYENILRTTDIEYIGSRLHGGIRALQMGKRTLILAVDNRAIEIKFDTNLNVVKRSDFESVLYFIKNPYCTEIKLPSENIKKWKGQFLE